MASTFTIKQDGMVEELVTVSLDHTFSHSSYWRDCGLIEVNLIGKTPSGREPTFNYSNYVKIEVTNNSYVLNSWQFVKSINLLQIWINPNVLTPDKCQLKDINANVPFPNGEITCSNPQPSGAAHLVIFEITSTDTNKVIIDTLSESYSYDVQG